MAVLVLFATCLVTRLVYVAQAQNQTATTDPAEARALNSIFEQWGIEAQSGIWNIGGEPCSGKASPNDSATIDDPAYNPFIKCDCSYDNDTTCHIIALKVYRSRIVGALPKELWTLTFLTNLNLGLNYIQGPLSASVGNLTRMQYLNFDINALSGELPKELENLTDLRMLAIGTNNFSGPLPLEIENLVKMEQLYMDSSGVSGEIPTTFAKLTNLQQIWASDTELTGRIPDFIGNYSKLSVLRLQGNSFEGPIPTSFSNLTSLIDLRISDLSNGTSSLTFINNMKSLSILILSNNNISGSIPSNIGEFVSLTQLDLSFNNLVGPIPDSLFNLTSLSFLFLGNNRLDGTLPEQKSSTLLNIDLSYNHLAGSFPSWVNNQTLQLNLVANNFIIGSSNSSVLPSGLFCLQRNFPCNRGLGKYYDFAIKCGGPAITSSAGIEYERDNETLGPATYFVTETNRWAVSNVGYFSGSFSASKSTSTLDDELFQTSRYSASSLRYYGLGLQNGNYNVILQFTETAFPPPFWRTLRRRVFDIYIQGNWVAKDFDIGKGAVSFVAVQRQFTSKCRKTSWKSISFGLEKELAAYHFKAQAHMGLPFPPSAPPQISSQLFLKTLQLPRKIKQG